jgi:hypothetical protein
MKQQPSIKPGDNTLSSILQSRLSMLTPRSFLNLVKESRTVALERASDKHWH